MDLTEVASYGEELTSKSQKTNFRTPKTMAPVLTPSQMLKLAQSEYPTLFLP